MIFAALRYFDNALWLGAVSLSLFLEHEYGFRAIVVAPIAAFTVMLIDFSVSGRSMGVFDQESRSERIAEDSRTSKLVKEIAALGYAAWAGSTSTTAVNTSLGLESSRPRRALQAAVFGIGVSLWATRIPPFLQGRNTVQDLARYALHKPLRAAAVGVFASLIVFAVLKLISLGRRRFETRRGLAAVSDTEPQ